MAKRILKNAVGSNELRLPLQAAATSQASQTLLLKNNSVTAGSDEYQSVFDHAKRLHVLGLMQEV